MGCICEAVDNPLRSGIPGVIALLKGLNNPVAIGIDYIQACPVCMRFPTHLEAAFVYYAHSAPAQVPSIKPESFMSWIEIQFLIHLYASQPFPTERLPYTNVFEAMVRRLNEFRVHQEDPERTEPISNYLVYAILTALRKTEQLPYKK